MCLFKLIHFKLLVLIFISVYSRVNTEENLDASTNVVSSFDDVPLEHYGPDPCNPRLVQMPDFHAPGRRISEVKCFEYVWRSKFGIQELKRQYHCDALHKKHPILGGHQAKLGECAHVGALGWKAIVGTWVFKCGASLISENFALTAAHCTKATSMNINIADPVPKIVRLGAETITDVDGYNLPATDAKIKRIVVHPDYHSPSRYYDIALIEFEEKAEFVVLVHPSCLHTTLNVQQTLYVAGWGIIDLGTLNTSTTLQVAEVTTIESDYCDFLLILKRNRNWNGTLEHEICAGNLTGGVDSCQGDSGGPLSYVIANDRYATHPFRWTVHRIVGVTSFGYGCGRAESPAIYTRVATFIDWIESIVWPVK